MVKTLEITKFAFPSLNLEKFHWEQNTSLLSIIISEASYKKSQFVDVNLIQVNKHQAFLLSHLTKKHSFIYGESHLNGETFLLKRVSLRIHTKNSNSQQFWLEFVVLIYKYLKKGFSTIITFLACLITRTYGFWPVWSELS